MQEIQDSHAKVDLYIQGQEEGPMAKFVVPFRNTQTDSSMPARYWGIFCFNGNQGLNLIKTLNYVGHDKPTLALCN